MNHAPRLLVDARPLVDPKAGGVRRVAMNILTSLIETEESFNFVFITTGARIRTLPEPFASHARVRHVHIRWPNKLWSALAMFGLVSIDRMANVRDSGLGGGGGGGGRGPPPPHPPESRNPNPETRTPAFGGALLMNLGFVGFMEVPYALVIHDLSFLIHGKWFPLKDRIWHYAVNPKEIARRANRIFTVSETTAKDAERLLDVPRKKIEVFHPGIPKLGQRAEIARFAGDLCPYVLAFGEQDPRKNAKTAVAAVKCLRKELGFENLRLVLIVSGKIRTSKPFDSPSDALEVAQGRQPNKRTWIIRLPAVTDAELADLYQNASAVLYPSWYEGFGLPLHEAARFGTPCLASTHGALPETAPQGTVFAPPGKPHLWASMLRDMLQAPNAYRTTFDQSAEKPDISPMLEWLRTIKRQ
jgi:glycosyltransferase involved in cell wall biosynthesis